MGIDRTAEFKAQPVEWRIAAVIHDGNWFEFQKWQKASKAKPEELQAYIDQEIANGRLIVSTNGTSYRTSAEEIIRWYKENNLMLDDRIIPRIFPPRIWGNLTETEAFIKIPRRQVGTVTFIAESPEIYDKCKSALRGVAVVRQDRKNRFRAHGLSHIYIKQCLAKNLTSAEYQKIQVKSRATLLQRELSDMPSSFSDGALKFYAAYARNALKSKMSTLKIYLPEEEDIQAQIVYWVISAIKKFDETKNVPFSGYLTQVLSHWPYDLPEEFLGKELAEFQRKKQRSLNELTANDISSEEISFSVLADKMGLTLAEFTSLEEQHRAWMAEKNAGSLTWTDSANEKAASLVGQFYTDADTERDLTDICLISLAIISAALETKEYEDAYTVIGQMDVDSPDATLMSSLSKKFVTALAKHISIKKQTTL